jgi:WD40 repeat protein
LELTGHDSDVKTSAFSPDGALIVCGLENGSVALWDAKTGDLIRKDVNRTSQIKAAAFSMDGESVLTIDAEGVVCKWNSERGHLLSTSQCDGAIGRAAAIHSGDDLIAVSETYTGIINFNSANTGKTIRSISIAEEKTPSEQENNSEEETENTTPEIEIRQLAFSKNANFLLASTQEEISLIDTKTGTSLKRYKTDSQPYTFVIFSQDERQFAASLNNAQTVLVWKTSSQELPIKLLVTDPNYPHNMMFSKDGMSLAVAYHYGPLRIWNVREKKIEKLLEPEASSLAYSCDGNYLATSDINGIINIWDTKTYSLVLKLYTAFEARYEMLQWSASSKYLLGLTRDGAIAVWNIPELSK